MEHLPGLNPAAPHYLPSFITLPGQSDWLMNVMAIFLLLVVVSAGIIYLKLHALPEHMAHRTSKVQLQFVAVLALLVSLAGQPLAGVLPLLGFEEPGGLGLEPGAYLTLICRPIPENTILELVRAFSRRERGVRLVVLGTYRPDEDEYHRAVMDAASDEVDFVGAIYDPDSVTALRFHGIGYLHGHTVGGTNPSLVEAMAAGNAIVAHDNDYNRWVAADGALYFRTEDDADAAITSLLEDRALRDRLSAAARDRHLAEFTWTHVAGQYEDLLIRVGGVRKPVNDTSTCTTGGHR